MTGSGDKFVHPRSILLAALLFLFGEKSDVLAKLTLAVYNLQFKDKPETSPDWVFEATWVGLAVGTAFVVFLSARAKDRNRGDDWAIATGLVTATLAALMNLVETWIDPDVALSVKVIKQVSFFYAIWVFVIVIPLIRVLGQHRPIRGSGIITAMLAFLVACVFAQVLFLIADYLIWPIVQDQGISAHGSIKDAQVYEAQTLLILVSVWAIIGFSMETTIRWSALYLAGAIVASIAYPVLLEKPSDWTGQISATQLVLFFPLLSLGALIPVALTVRELLAGSMQKLSVAACGSAIICAAIVYLYWVAIWPGSYELMVVSGFTAVNSALAVFVVYCTGRILARWPLDTFPDE